VIDAAGPVLLEKELQIDRLLARELELEWALEDAGIMVPPGNGESLLELYRVLMGICDRTDWLLRGDESLRDELAGLVERARSLMPVCREGDHAIEVVA
jgi:hypothetical protein